MLSGDHLSARETECACVCGEYGNMKKLFGKAYGDGERQAEAQRSC